MRPLRTCPASPSSPWAPRSTRTSPARARRRSVRSGLGGVLETMGPCQSGSSRRPLSSDSHKQCSSRQLMCTFADPELSASFVPEIESRVSRVRVQDQETGRGMGRHYSDYGPAFETRSIVDCENSTCTWSRRQTERNSRNPHPSFEGGAPFPVQAYALWNWLWRALIKRKMNPFV